MNVCKTKDYSKAEEFVDQFMLEAYATSQVTFLVLLFIITSTDYLLKFHILTGYWATQWKNYIF